MYDRYEKNHVWGKSMQAYYPRARCIWGVRYSGRSTMYQVSTKYIYNMVPKAASPRVVRGLAGCQPGH